MTRTADSEIVEVFVAAYQRDAEFARAFWASDEAPADALRTLFRPVRRRLHWYSRTAFRLLPYQPRCMVMQLAVTPSAQGRGTHARSSMPFESGLSRIESRPE